MTRAAAKFASHPLTALAVTWLAPALVLALVCWGTLSAQDPMPKYFGGQDKIEHVVAFMLLGAAFTLAASSRFIALVTGSCICLAVGVELGQAVLTLHREPSLRDAAASVIGSLMGIGASAAVRLLVNSHPNAPLFCVFRRFYAG